MVFNMLHLLPNTFFDEQPIKFLLPEGLCEIIEKLDGLIAESEKNGRRFLLKIMPGSEHARRLPILLLNEHSDTKNIEEIAMKICDGGHFGLISDAGVPMVADPGSLLVDALRKKGYASIVALPGPSSILLALQLSGFSGQKFMFHGYLPRESFERIQALKNMEKVKGVTHICIETPYRNEQFLRDCKEALQPTTRLCIAASLTMEAQSVQVHEIRVWRRKEELLGKQPVVFLIRNE